MLNQYLRYLEVTRKKEFQIDDQLITQKLQMEKDIHKLKKKVNYLRYEIIKFGNIKNILISAKYGYNAIKNKDKNKEDISLFITESNENENVKENENINVIENKEKSCKNIKKIKSINPKFSKSIKNIKTFYKHNILDTDNNRNTSPNTNTNTNPNTTMVKDKKSGYRKSYSTETDKNKNSKKRQRLNNIFANFENSIINSINSYNTKKNNIYQLEQKLSQSRDFQESEYIYEEKQISSKSMKIHFLRKENKQLKSRYNLIKKTTTINDSLKNTIEQKLYNILINMNEEINIQETISIRNLFNLLKLKNDEFLEKMKLSKLIYMIKVIELIYSFLNNIKVKYFNDPNLKQKYKNIKNIVEKDKNLRINILNKEKLKQQLEERKLHFLKKSTQLRFFTYKKYDVKSKKYKKCPVLKININNKNDSKINYEKWLTYT